MKTLTFNSKKVIAVLVAAMMCLLSFVYYQPNADAVVNTDMSYVAFNAKTGARIKSYTIGAMPGAAPAPRSMVDGVDDRVVDYSKNGVVLLESHKYNDTSRCMRGTAFVVNEHVIMTAAHCIYDSGSSKSRILDTIKLFNSSGKVELNATAVQIHVPQLYIDGIGTNHDYNPDYDYALITIKEDLSKYMCFNVGVPLDSFFKNSSPVTITGFPLYTINSEDPNSDMYTSSGTVLPSYNEICFDCTAFISGGNSGGPVYVTETANGQTYYTVIGILIASTDYNNPPNYSIGFRITNNTIRFIYANKNLSYT